MSSATRSNSAAPKPREVRAGVPIRTPDGVNNSLLGRIHSEEIHRPLASGKPGKTVLAEKSEVVTTALLADLED